MTAKSVLLNTVIVSKTCVGPWHNLKMLKRDPFLFQGPPATWRKLSWYLLYEMLYLQLCCQGKLSVKNIWLAKGELKRDELC